jgi:cytochrome c
MIALAGAQAWAQGDAQRGKTLFSRCSGCHATSGYNRVGPGLAGIFGRKAGAAEGFNYSSALAASGLTWDEQALDAFLAAPEKAVPGTKQTIVMSDTADRADMIAYLKTLGR